MSSSMLRVAANSKRIGRMSSLILLSFGMHCILRGIVLPVIKTDFGLSYTALSTIVSFASIGYFIVALFSSKINEKIGQKSALTLYALVLMTTAILITFAKQWTLLTFFFFVAGGSYGGIESAATAILKRYNPVNSDIAVNNAFGFYSIGSLSIAVLGGWILFSGYDWRTAYYIVVVFAAIAFLYSLRIEDKASDAAPHVDLSQLKNVLRDKTFVLMCFATALLSGAESASINWMNTFLSNTVSSMNIFESSCTTALFFAGIFMGRIVISKLLLRFDSTILTIICGLVSGGVVLVISFVDSALFILVGIALFGFSVSCLYPLLISITNGLSSYSIVYSLTFTVISVFNFLVNYLMGVIADWLSMPSAFRFCAVLYLVVAVIVGLCSKEVLKRRVPDEV